MAKRIVIPPKPDTSSSVSMDTLGQFVKFRRTTLGMTIDEAASLCGVSKQALSNVEKSLESVRMDTVFKIINSLGIKLWIKSSEEIDINGESDSEWL